MSTTTNKMRYLIPTAIILAMGASTNALANSTVRTAVNKSINGGAAGTTSCGSCHSNGGDGYSDLTTEVVNAWGASISPFTSADLAVAPGCGKVDALRALFKVSGTTCPAAANNPPVVSPISISGTAGTAISYQASATDPDQGDTIASWSVSGAPNGLAISNSGLITWANPVQGSYSFTVSATDSHSGTGTANASLTVAAAPPPPPPTNHAPVVTVPNSSVTTTADKGISFAVTATDPDQGDSVVSLTASGTAIDNGATFVNGSFDWQPAAGQTLPQGAYSVTFTATDTTGAPGTATVNITVDPAGTVSNTAPTLTITPSGQQNVMVGKELALTIVTADTDGDDVGLTAAAGTSDMSSALTQDATDPNKWTFKYTWTALPSPNPVAITFTATDQPTEGTAKSASQTVNVQVNQDTGSGTGAVTAVNFTKAVWSSTYHKIAVAGTVQAATGAKVAGLVVTITDQNGTQLGTTKVTRRKTWSFSKSGLSVAPCSITATVDGVTATRPVSRAPSSCTETESESSDDSKTTSASTTTTSTSTTTTTTPKKKKGKSRG